MSALTEWWITHKQAPEQAEIMWDSWAAPHRKNILHALGCLPPMESLYEIGCGGGPNLRLLQAEWHAPLRLGGSDAVQGLATWAQDHLHVPIDCAELPHVPTDPWDVVLSCYTMAYLDESDVARLLNNLHRIHTKALILLEPNAGVYRHGVGLPEYMHDYCRLLPDAGWTITWRWPVMPPANGLNAVIVAERAA